LGESTDAGTYVHGDAGQIGAAHLAFTAVQPAADLNSDSAGFLGD